MHFRLRKLLILPLFVLAGLAVPSQSQPASTGLYTKMLGIWVGYDDTVQNGVAKHIAVEIRITAKKDSVQMDYTYSKPGQVDFSTVTKWMKLDPQRSEMTLRWKNDMHGERYKTIGLNEFSRSGLGKFIATGRAVGPNGGNGRFEFDLSPEQMSYQWLTETSPGSFSPITTFTLHRLQN
jgi:hypothetical protein